MGHIAEINGRAASLLQEMWTGSRYLFFWYDPAHNAFRYCLALAVRVSAHYSLVCPTIWKGEGDWLMQYTATSDQLMYRCAAF